MAEIVYVLTNEYMPGIVKIGRTENIENRMRQLYKTGVPIPFECYYAAEVEDSKKTENQLHRAYADSRINENREFFKLSPEATRSAVEMAALKDVTPADRFNEGEEDVIAIQKARKIREAFNFDMVSIAPGSELSFARDKEIKATVIDSRKIRFREEVTSLSAAANTILDEMGAKDRGVKSNVAGPFYWKYEGEILAELRIRLEQDD